MKCKNFILGALAALSIFVFFPTCEIGLGESVDTEPATGSISSPGVNAVIRKAFAIKGEWHDEAGVKQVAIDLKYTSEGKNKGKSYSYNATINKDNSWICKIDPESQTQPLVDGTYLATIIIYDNGGHQTKLERSYIIDNTAPVVILSYLKPDDDTQTEIKTYGQNFYLSGKAADDNNINSIDVKLYDEKGTHLTTVTKKNVPAAIEQDVATYGNEEYNLIYYSDVGGTQVKYCEIIAYDDAKRYPMPGEESSEDNLGNCQEKYYFQTKLETTEVEGTGKHLDEYKTNDLYHMLNGTYTSSDSARVAGVTSDEEVEKVIEALSKIGVERGTFQLNPKNNPTFTVIGLNQALPEGESMYDKDKKEPKTAYQVTNGDADSGIPLTISVTPGLDNYSIDNSSLKMYFQECDEKGNIKESADKITIPNAEKSTTIKTSPISTANFAGLKLNTYYKVCVTGTDTKNNDIVADISGTYAFYLAPTNGVIELTLTGKPWGKEAGEDTSAFEPATNYVSSVGNTGDYENYTKFKVTLNYSYTGDTALNVYRKKAEETNWSKINSTALSEGNDQKYYDLIDAGELTSEATTYIYQLSNKTAPDADDETSYSRERSITIKLDNIAPVILNSGSNKISYPSASDTKNLTLRFEGKASDSGSGVEKVYVKLYDVNDPSKFVTKTATGNTNWSLQIVRGETEFATLLADEGKKKAEFWAVDKVGIKGEVVSIDWIYKPSEPTFKLSAYKEDGAQEETSLVVDLLSNKGEFATGKVCKLTGIAEDKFGIQKIEVTQTDETGTKKTAYYKAPDDKDGMEYDTQTKMWTIPTLPLGGKEAGKSKIYTYVFKITDQANLPVTSKELTVTVDDAKPAKATITYPASTAFGISSLSGDSYTFRGGYTDKAIGIGKILYVIKKTGSALVDSDWKDTNAATFAGGNWSFSKSLANTEAGYLAEGKWTVYIKVIDKANNESEVASLPFCVDQAVPAVAVELWIKKTDNTEEQVTTTAILKDESIASFYSKVVSSDSNGIAAVTVKNGDTDITATGTLSTDKKEWKSPYYETQSEYNFSILVEDGSGNGKTGTAKIEGKKTSVSNTVLFDKTAPTITVTNADAAATTVVSWFSGTGTAYITGTSKDEESGIKTRRIKIDTGSWVDLPNADDWTYQLNLTAAALEENDETAESCHTITVEAVDKAGNYNKADKSVYYFRYDKAAPILTADINKDSINKDGTITISGKVYDDGATSEPRPVKKLELKAKRNGNAVDISKYVTLSPSSSLSGDYSYLIVGKVSDGELQPGTYSVSIVATDYAKNEVSKDLTFKVDNTAPTISKVEEVIGQTTTEISKDSDNSSKWYGSQTLKMIITASDNSNGSGLENVYWLSMDKNSSLPSDITTADWQPFTKKSTTSFEGTVVFDDTAAKEGSKLYIRAVDKAGNSAKFKTKVSSSDPNSGIDHIVFNIDTQKPALTLEKVKIGATDSRVSTGTEYINNTSGVVLYGTYSNTISGVNELKFYKAGSDTPLTASVKYFDGEIPEGKTIETLDYVTYNSITEKNSITYWKAEFANSALSTGDLSVEGSNIAGVSTGKVKLFTLNKDVKKPELNDLKISTDSSVNKVYEKKTAGTKIIEAYYVNNKNQLFEISGSAEDNNDDDGTIASGVANVKLKIDGAKWPVLDDNGNPKMKEDGSTPETTDTKTSTTALFKDLDLSEISTDGKIIHITVLDKAGNAETFDYTIKFDTAAPQGRHEIDGKVKDLYFRMGEANRSDEDGKTSSGWDPAWSDSLDKDVGGKYSPDTFGKLNTQKIRGKFEDTGSGVSLIYYKNFTSEPTTDDLDDFLTKYESDHTGYFSPIATEKRRVFYTTTSGTKDYKEVESNYKTTLSDFVEGVNYVVLLAVDRVGNAAIDTVSNYKINVDQTLPTIVSASTTELYRNGNADETISGTYVDAAAGLKSISFSFDTSTPTASFTPDTLTNVEFTASNKDTITSNTLKDEKYAYLTKANFARIKIKKANDANAEYSYYDVINTTSPETTGVIKFTPEISEAGTYIVELGNGIWSATISSSVLQNLAGKTKTLFATALDYAENSKTDQIVATIIVDREYPKVEISTLNSTINKLVPFKITANDNTGITEIQLQYKKTSEGASAWKTYETLTASDTVTITNPYTWNLNVDTKKKVEEVYLFEDETSYDFRAVAIDNAENIGNSGNSTSQYDTAKSKTAKISQDSDRPIIKFVELQLPAEGTAIPCQITDIDFRITDDDKTIVKSDVEYQITEKSATTYDNDNWIDTDLKYENGLFTLSKMTQGQQKLWFKVNDGISDFISTATAAEKLTAPKITDSTESAPVYSNNTVALLKVDTKQPTVKNAKYSTGEKDKDTGKTKWIDLADIEDEKFGGTTEKGKQTLKVCLYAYDANAEDTDLDCYLTIPALDGDKSGTITKLTLNKATTEAKPDGIDKLTISDTDSDTGKTIDLDLYYGEMTIDSKYATGKRKCTLTVTEGVKPNNRDLELNIDNQAPTFDLSSPKSTKVIVGDIEITGYIKDNDGGSGFNEKVKYYIPPYADRNKDPSTIADNKWKEQDVGAFSLSLILNKDDVIKLIGFDDKTSTAYNDYKGYIDSTSKLYKLPVWLCLEDNYGNYDFVNKDDKGNSIILISYNADADTPVIEISEPANDEPKEDPEYIVMGGRIKITGTASDGVDKVQHVYLQFAKGTKGVDDTYTWADFNNEGIVSSEDLVDISSITGTAGDKAVEATVKNHSMNINWSYELDVLNLEDQTGIKVRAIAVDEKTTNPLHSAWSSQPLCIHVGNTKPNIRINGFRRYHEAITEGSTVNADDYEIQRDYSKDMYQITKDGYWYIYGEAYVKNDNHITEINATGDLSFSWKEGRTASGGFSWTDNIGVTQKFLIPLEKGTIDGIFETTISTKGHNGTEGKNENETSLSFVVDNTAPDYSEKNTGAATDGTIKLRRNRTIPTDVYDSGTTSDKNMKNDSGKTTIAGGITEARSGFKRVAFYFVRGTDVYDVYNIMETSSNTTTLLPDDSTATGLKRNTEKLPAITLTGTTTVNTFAPSAATVITGNKNIRIGGLVKIGYEYHTITEVASDGKVTFTPYLDSKYVGSEIEAEFVYAMVVDNSGETASTQEGDITITEATGDGDGIFEYFGGSPTTWEAAFNSKNIPDGPINIYCVVFDDAGNTREGWTKTFIANNRPRITSVMLGTDLDTDDKYDLDKEFKTYYKNGATRKTGVDRWDLSAWEDAGETTFWTAKKGLVVIPEFVGGNGDIYYYYSKKETVDGEKLETAEGVTRNTDSKLVTKIAKIIKSSVPESLTDGYDLTNLKAADNKNGALILEKGDTDAVGSISVTGDFTKNNTGTVTNAGVNVYRFSFRDSTNGGSHASETQWCVLNVTLKQDLVDGTAPTGYITPFYWRKSDQGVIQSSTVYENQVAQGHIELPGTSGSLPSATFNANSGEMDTEPKVSGKIKVEGTAFDETMLKTITLSFDGKAVTATYTPHDVTVNNVTTPKGWAYTAASGTSLTDFNLVVRDANDGPTQDGHSVTWTYTVDTSKASSAAIADRVITVAVSDSSSNNSTPGTTPTAEGEGNQTGYYKVDIVPYITEIYTELSNAYSSNPSVFNRSALGSYPVRRDSDITIKGFNLMNGTTKPTIKLNNTAGLITVKNDVTTGDNPKVNSSTTIYATVGSGTTVVSGDLDLYVGTIYSLNNKTSKTAGYNQEKNGINNDILTDKRDLKVWSFTQPVTGSTIRYPTMKVGKNADQTVAFTYDLGGADTYAFKTTTLTGVTPYNIGHSYTQWYDTVTAVDSNGNLFSGAMNGDCLSASEADDYSDCANYYFFPRVGNHTVWAYDTNSDYGKAWENAYNGTFYNSTRILNPKLSTLVNGTSTKIYAVYYDASMDEVKFRYGTVDRYRTVSDALGNYDTTKNGSATDFQVIAGPGAQGNSSITDADGSTTNSKRAGEYAAVGVVPKAKSGTDNDVAVVAWYDEANQRLLFSYNTNPTSTANAAQWGQHTKIIDTNFVGWYVDMVVAPDGGIHIAYYDASGIDLKYAYLPSYTGDVQKCKVDSYLSVGTNISIEVPTAKEAVEGSSSTRYVPRISYFMGAFTKTKNSLRIATLHKLGSDGKIADGVTNDKFTGNWEVMTVPTDQIPLDYTIGVGIKKNDSNVDSTLLGYGTKTGLQTAALQ